MLLRAYKKALQRSPLAHILPMVFRDNLRNPAHSFVYLGIHCIDEFQFSHSYRHSVYSTVGYSVVNYSITDYTMSDYSMLLPIISRR